MLSSSELKKQARNSLKDKWSHVVLLTLIYMALSTIISIIAEFVPGGSLISLIFTVPFSYGFIYTFIKIYRNEEFKYRDFFTSAFTNFAKVWKVTGNQLLKLILPIILVVISLIIILVAAIICSYTINSQEPSQTLLILSLVLVLIGYIGYIASLIFLLVKELLYTLSLYILYDNPNMTGKEIVETSEKIMKGQRKKYFCLELSFIGWILLSFITFGIGLIFVLPYLQASAIAFYEDRIGKIDK